MRARLTLLLAMVFGLPAMANAHFLWIVTQPDEKAPADKVQVAKVYFSETAAPDDPALLDRVAKAQAWSLSDQRGESKALKLVRKDDALVAEIPAERHHAPVVLRQTYGVTTRGGESFLLNYYAKGYPFPLPGTWRGVNDAELLKFEIVPRLDGEAGVAFKVLWQGEPQAGETVTVEGPGLSAKIEGTTDERGVFRCRLAEAGLYSIRARHTETKSGEHEGKAYQAVRHYTTLALPFSPLRLQPSRHDLPALTRGITSFGAAVAGDWLYVYGGHIGRAHEYSKDEQSGDLLRVNLRDPKAWEMLPGGPKLAGTALVAHAGKIFRIGGFTARNSSDQPESLWSQNDFSRFDPTTGGWQSLAPLPHGRSSHDAAVLGNTLYVVGGWEMKESEKNWHDTMLAIDLSSADPAWKVIPQPFQRRALSVAVWHDRLYAMGGMLPKGDSTTAVSVYDPATKDWSDGPPLIGGGLEGFGSSAFACGENLFVTTISGAVQQLSKASPRWEIVGQLAHPRFFHRLLPWQNDKLVIVGGANMMTGKILELELLPVSESPPAATK